MQASDGHSLVPAAGRSDISLARIYLPFAMVLAFGGFLMVAGYTAGGLMSNLTRDKSETETRLGAIEREITAIKGILADKSALGQPVCKTK